MSLITKSVKSITSFEKVKQNQKEITNNMGNSFTVNKKSPLLHPWHTHFH